MTCADCDLPPQRRGLCNRHYQRRRLDKMPLPLAAYEVCRRKHDRPLNPIMHAEPVTSLPGHDATTIFEDRGWQLACTCGWLGFRVNTAADPHKTVQHQMHLRDMADGVSV